MFHELPAATVDMTVLLSELQALRAGSRASSVVGPCDVLFKIHEISGLVNKLSSGSPPGSAVAILLALHGTKNVRSLHLLAVLASQA
jgi:hypothetical protein